MDFHAAAEELLAAHAGSNLYFLLDHGGLPGLHRELLKYSVEWASLFENTKEANALAVAPIIVSVGSENRLSMPRLLLDWLGENGIYTSSVVLLSSPLPIGCMKKRLVRRLDARLTENIDVMLRFFDPRVLESLAKILTAEQREEFFGLAISWGYVDRVGELKRIATAFNSEESFSPPLLLSQQQESALINASEVDQVLNLLRSTLPALTASLTLPDQYMFVSRQIGAARQLGLDSVLQFSLYAAAIWSEGESFVDSPSYSYFLDEIKAE